MSLKLALVLMTVIAVISDSMLHPFYPQYFAAVFGVADARQVGLYIAACSLTVMLAFPLWARLSTRIPVLQLLIATQLITAALSLICWTLDSLPAFWVVSLGMMVFKASYLLIYPYVMSLEHETQHVGTISLLAFAMYSGNTLAALCGGAVLQWMDPRFMFVGMALGDLLQTAICVQLLRGAGLQATPEDDTADAEAGFEASPVPNGFVYKLGAVMLVLYFSAYVSEPFFSSYWEGLSAQHHKLLSGLVFAIPGIAALGALYANTATRDERSPYAGIALPVALAVLGLALQLSGQLPVMLGGRLLYGWALFQAMVRLDRLLFRVSSKHSYALDFGKINIFQGLGVQLASFAAGALVTGLGVAAPLWVATAGFVAGLLAYATLFRGELRTPRHQNLQAPGLRDERAVP